MAIINSIEQLKTTAKVNKSTPFEAFEPFLQEAQDTFLVRYLGEEMLQVLEMETVPSRATTLLELTQKALGPLALWLGISELSVRMGDAGFTVEKRDGSNNGAGYVPASDAKIEKLAESFERRGFTYLDQVLEHLEANATDFPEWRNSRYYSLRAGNYIQSATQFQEIGGVNIEYSRLTFEHLRPVLGMLEMRFVSELLGDALDTSLRSKLNGSQTTVEKQLITAIRRFVACKTAELHTSQASKSNRETQKEREYKPLIRPVYADVASTGNFFAEQAAFYYSKVQQLLNTNAVELGITPVDGALNWNSTDNKIFTDIG
jgi:hypothetical protein